MARLIGVEVPDQKKIGIALRYIYGIGPTLAVEVCSNCHPFFTGTQKFVDTAGRVERFQKRYAKKTK